MSNEFQVPAKPWGDAEIAQLKAHAHLLDEETRAELGLGPVEVEEPTPSDDGNIDPSTITPEDVQAGVEAFNQLSPEEQEAAKAEAQAQMNPEGDKSSDEDEKPVEKVDADSV